MKELSENSLKYRECEIHNLWDLLAKSVQNARL
jgi:hypothetical protein